MRVSKRLIYAFLGLLAGEVALLLILLPHASSLFMLYAVFFLVGWVHGTSYRAGSAHSWVWLIAVASLLPAGLLTYFFARVVQHSVRIQKEMTWECAPDQ
jgi:hypothetical protein